MPSLTASFLSEVTHPGRYADDASTGLYFVVANSGAKSWSLRYQMNKRRREAGLGAYPDVRLKAARQRATELRVLIEKGIDPIEAKRAYALAQEAEAKGLVTFRDDAMDFIQANRKTWTEKHADQWRTSLETYAFPRLGGKAVSQITTEDILEVLNPIWHDKPTTARRVRNRIERVIDYSRTLGHRKADNPARWSGHLSTVMARGEPRVVPHAAMAHQDVPGFMWRLDAEEGTYARALELTILTCVRTSEMLGAKWDEFDFEEAVWTIPAERMKAREQHRVPLVPQVVERLLALRSRKTSPFLFPNRSQKSHLPDNALRRVMIKLQVPHTVHGFRASYRTWAAEETEHDPELCEVVLAHAVKTKTQAAYQRGDLLNKRRQLMQDWANHALSLVV